jgi:hypothetical protein
VVPVKASHLFPVFFLFLVLIPLLPSSLYFAGNLKVETGSPAPASPAPADNASEILITQNATTFNCSVSYLNGTVYYTSEAFHLHDAVANAIVLTSLVNVSVVRIAGNVSYDHTVHVGGSSIRVVFDHLYIRTDEDALELDGAYAIQVDGGLLQGNLGTLVRVEDASYCAVSITSLFANGPSAIFLESTKDWGISSNEFNLGNIIGGTRQIRLLTNGSWIGSNTFNVQYMQCRASDTPTRCISVEVVNGSLSLNTFNHAVIESAANNTAIYSESLGGEFFFQCQVFDIGESALAVNNSGVMYCSQTMWALSRVNNTGLIYYDGHLDGDTWEYRTFVDDGRPGSLSLVDFTLLAVVIALIVVGVVLVIFTRGGKKGAKTSTRTRRASR